jgi:hypothetical protein
MRTERRVGCRWVEAEREKLPCASSGDELREPMLDQDGQAEYLYRFEYHPVERVDVMGRAGPSVRGCCSAFPVAQAGAARPGRVCTRTR